MPPLKTEQTRWFVSEVQPHEPALRAYLQARFPRLGDSDDVIQETYVRVLREWTAGQLRHTRAFLFTAARNIAIDFFRRQCNKNLTTVPHPDATDVVDDTPGVVEVLGRQQTLDLLAEAVRALPDRCRQVVMLRYVKGRSYKEIAAILGISTETVKTHLERGVQRCGDYLRALGMDDEGSEDVRE
jgi:RNA polymerase sigma-70 factor (ECF subfamily)